MSGYLWQVAALIGIAFISFGVWVHHMFATGLPTTAMGFFSAASFVIAIPSAVLYFAWIGTMWGGRVRFTTPMLFALGFLLIFLLGGITGVMVAALPFDLQVTDTYFIVAHFHYVLNGAVVFPIFGAIYYWMPKMTGRLLNERLGKWSFWTMLIGFNVTFGPMHVLGELGMARRMYTYDDGLGWDTLNLVISLGSLVFAGGTLLTVVNVIISLAAAPTAVRRPVASRHARVGHVVATTGPQLHRGAGRRRPAPAVGAAERRCRWPTQRGALGRATPVTGGLDTRAGGRAGRPPTDGTAGPRRPRGRPVLRRAAGIGHVGAHRRRDRRTCRPRRLGLANRARRAAATAGSAVTDALVLTAQDRSRRVGWWGMMILIATEAMIFAALLSSYFFVRANSTTWPQGGIKPPELAKMAVFTVVLLASSLPLFWGEAAIRRGKVLQLRVALAFSWLLGRCSW